MHGRPRAGHAPFQDKLIADPGRLFPKRKRDA
jgi:hypothetical protein